MSRVIGQNFMTLKGEQSFIYNFLGKQQVVHFETVANLFASRVEQIFFTQSWQLNDFKQELKKKLSSFYTIKAPKSTNKATDNAMRTFQRGSNICDLINSYDL